jgi:hypothetical protein
MVGVLGGVWPPYPNVRIWSMPTSSSMMNKMLGGFGAAFATTGRKRRAYNAHEDTLRTTVRM